MINHYDIMYGLGVGVSAPYWLIKPAARRKVFSAFRHRMGNHASGAPRDFARPAVMIHAVSLGEVNATVSLVQSLQQAQPTLQVIVSTTTDTGFERAQQLYAQKDFVTLIRYPLDFSRAVNRVLDNLKPDVVVLMELEVWPNFLRGCAQRQIPVVLVNGRLTSSSFSRYRWIKPLAGGMFKRLAQVCAQDETYARRFVKLGVDPALVQVTGTMKFDTAHVADRIAGDEDLASAVGLFPGVEPIWVCGSTGPGEEEIILRVYRQLLMSHSRLRLAIIPRKPERFDQVAALIEAARFKVLRRSTTIPTPDNPSPRLPPGLKDGPFPPVVLGDTMGELRKFYSIANVVFVGRSLVNLGPRQHGSDMIEPAALGRAVIVGPFTGNFAEVINRLRADEAIIEISDEAALQQTVSVLLFSPDQAQQMGRRAQQVVVREKGATTRHVAVVLQNLRARRDSLSPASQVDAGS